MITKKLSFAFYLMSCFALSWDHPPVFIETSCRLSSHHPLNSPVFGRTDRANFQTHLEELIPFDPELHKEIEIDICVENFSGAVLKSMATSTSKRRPRDDPRLPIPAGILDDIRLKNRLRKHWQFTRKPL